MERVERTSTSGCQPHPASFRDPSGFIFRHDGILYRQVNRSYSAQYDGLRSSGLYARLVGKGWLLPHEEVESPIADADTAFRILRPEPLTFISYPYEWCFSQLKHAALLTLEIQEAALHHGMTLKDASAYNVQFHRGRPVFIDTLSFEQHVDGQPWIAYRQFCQHFLAPLALMARRHIRLGQLAELHLDGVPLQLASGLLPWMTWLRPGLLGHLHLHALAQGRYADNSAGRVRATRVSKAGLIGLVQSLKSTVGALTWEPSGTQWAEYYSDTNYSESAAEDKEKIVSDSLDAIRPASVADLGANTGRYSRLAAARGIDTLALDVDPGAVERNYRECVARKEEHMLPLLVDLNNPSPALGWQQRERAGLGERLHVDAALALALVHHLAIGNNVPLERIAAFLREICRWLIIEFVPKDDSQVRRLLATREDIFPDYSTEGFERSFARHFSIDDARPIRDSGRVLYRMRRKD